MEPNAKHEVNLLDLPNEMVFKIINYLKYEDQLSLSLANRKLFDITKSAIENQTILNIEFPLPDLEMVSKLTRTFESVSMRYWDFVYEYHKIESYVHFLNYGPKIIHLQVYIDDFQDSKVFEKFIISNRNLRRIIINEEFKDLIKYCSEKFPEIELRVIKSIQSVQNTSLNFDRNFLENLELFNSEDDYIKETDLIKNLAKFQNIKCLRLYNFKSAESPNDVLQLMKQINFSKLDKLKRLDLYYSEEIANKSPFVSLLQNLENLMCHFQNDELEYTEESFKFAQSIYENNEKTLKVLTLKIFGIPQIVNFLPTSNIRLNEFHFFSCDTNVHTLNFLTKLLEQQSLNLEKLSLEGITINEEISEKIANLKNLNEISFRTCEIDSIGKLLNCNLKTLKISFSSISFDCLKSIFENDQLKNNIEILQLDDFQMTSTKTDRFNNFVFPKLKGLVYKTYGDGEEVEDFIAKLEAPSLERLKYGFVWNSAPSFQKFSNIKVLVVQPLYKNVDDIYLLMNLVKLEVLDIFIDTEILSNVLQTVCNELEAVKMCRIKCHSKSDGFDTISEICQHFTGYNKSYQMEIHTNENNNYLKYIKIVNLKLTVYVHMEMSDVLYYYENLLNNLF